MRTYKRKQTLDKDRRMAVAVRLTREGLSLRQAAARLSVSYQTVANDLRRHHEGSLNTSRVRAIDQGNIRRAQLAGVLWEEISFAIVAERDGWQCGICGKPVPREWDDGTRKLMPSLDHVVPIEHGGPHLYSNVQLTHLFCNLSKGCGKREPWRVRGLTQESLAAAAREVFARESLSRLATAENAA